MRLVVVFGVAMIVVLAAWVLWPRGAQNETVAPMALSQDNPIFRASDVVENEPPAGWVPPEITFESYQSEHGPLPASLEGTRIPFDLMVDDQGRLIVNQNLRRFFDYFFTLDGEEPTDTILARIEELIATHLPATAQQRALEILYQYYDLKLGEIEFARQMDADFNASGTRANLEDIKGGIRDLRAGHLDPEVYDAFFGTEDRRDEYTLARMEIEKDTSLTEEERRQALMALEHSLPQSDREYLAEERQVRQVNESIAQARAQGASEAEIFHIRQQAYGAEAAERFAIADKEIATWDGRVANYREQRRQILATEGLSESDKEAAIQALREQHFEGTELQRIPVIDSMLDAEE